MTDPASSAPLDSGDAKTFHDPAGELHDWDLRPWLFAGLLGVVGLVVFLLTDGAQDVPSRMAIAAALLFGSLALAFTLSQERWRAPGIFAGIVALVMAGVTWRATSAGDRYADEEFWVAAGLLAIGLATPLFQASFHRDRLKTSYKATHFHVWTDAISGAGALAFVGISWALLILLSELFGVIQITLLKDLIDQDWFPLTFSGAAFGAALGVLRNQLKIIGTLQNVVLLVLSILAVPLAIALVIFLIAVAVSGLDVLWEATRSATPLLLAIAVGCFVLTNSVVRDDDENASQSRPLRIAGFVLALGILPLAVMAAISMGTRIGQHGLSPERLWALVAIAVAVAYGVGYFVSAIRGWRTLMEGGWREHLRQSNLHLAVLTCVIAFILALPLFNFGSVSASNQLARLESGKVSVKEFDYDALRWDFGDAGREALEGLAASDNAEIATLAKAAEEQEQRPYLEAPLGDRREMAAKADIAIEDDAMAQAVRTYIANEIYDCGEPCRAVQVGDTADGPLIVLVTQFEQNLLVYDAKAKKVELYRQLNGKLVPAKPSGETKIDRAKGAIELRPFTGRQLYVDGKPVGEPFE